MLVNDAPDLRDRLVQQYFQSYKHIYAKDIYMKYPISMYPLV